MILPYLLVFAASLVVDCIPVFAPPAWTLMILIMLKFDLNPYVVVAVGTCGTVSGRLIFVTYIVPWFGNKTIGAKKDADLKFLGKKLAKKGVATFLIVFVYALLPLSTTVLFMAVGFAKVKRLLIIPPFFLGHLIGNGALLISGKYAIKNLSDLYKGSLDPKSIIVMAAGLLVMLLLLFIDWRKLLEHKEFQLQRQFWK